MNLIKDLSSSISIIVINFNGRKWLKGCFESLEKLDYPEDSLEIIMGDNASSDHSVEWMKQHFPKVRVVQFDKNYGFCKANNRCAEQAQGKYLAFLNNDAFVTPGWLKHLLAAIQSESDIRMAVGKILVPDLEGGRVLNGAGGIFLPTGGIEDGWMEVDAPAYQTRRYTGFGCGAGILVERDFFISTGGFDEYFFYSCEDIDLGLRVWLHGYKVVYEPASIMYHYMGGSDKRGLMTSASFVLATRNNLYFLLKNYQWRTLLKGLFLFHVKLAFSIFRSVIARKWGVLAAVFQGYRECLGDFRRILEIRRKSQRKRKIPDSALYENNLLLGVRESIKRLRMGIRNTERYGWRTQYAEEDRTTVCFEGNDIFFKSKGMS